MKRLRQLVVVAALALLPAAALAVQPDEQLADPEMEARARAISAGLRCLVCQNQSIDDSDAPLARDLRLLVRARLEAGDSNTAARDFIVARYGEFVLLRPPFDLATALLWLTPILVLVAGVTALAFRGRRRATVPAPLSVEEEARLGAILDRTDDIR